MNVAELRERLAEFPDHHPVMAGSVWVSEVRDQTQVIRSRGPNGGQATDALVVVVIT